MWWLSSEVDSAINKKYSFHDISRRVTLMICRATQEWFVEKTTFALITSIGHATEIVVSGGTLSN